MTFAGLIFPLNFVNSAYSPASLGKACPHPAAALSHPLRYHLLSNGTLLAGHSRDRTEVVRRVAAMDESSPTDDAQQLLFEHRLRFSRRLRPHVISFCGASSPSTS